MEKISDKIKEHAAAGKLTDEMIAGVMEDVDDLVAEVCHCHPEAAEKLRKRLHERLDGKHYDEHYARCRVKKMFNSSDMRMKERVPAWSLDHAAEHFKKWKQHLPAGVTVYDVYVALNAQHEDCEELYASWFKDEDEMRSRIAESAMHFWFMDVDYPHGQDVKVWDYFEH